MSNIKFKNQIERYENPETVFTNGKFNEYKYVIKSNQSDVIIFAKDKKFFKNRKPYVKKLLISDGRFKQSEEILHVEKVVNETTDKILTETISNIAKENAKLKETCDGLTSTIMNQNNTTNKLNNLNNSITLELNQYYLELCRTTFLSEVEPGSYFIQQMDEASFSGRHQVEIFKLHDERKASIYNTYCVGVFIVEITDEHEIKLLDYHRHNYGKSYLTIAKEQWGFQHSFTTLLKERPMIELNENNIVIIPEKMPVYNIGDKNDKLSYNIHDIICVNRVHDALVDMLNLGVVSSIDE